MIFASSPWLACYQRWINPAKKDKGNHQSHPDDKAEQAEQINRRQPADTFLPKLSEIAHHAGREKRHNEEDTAKSVGFSHGRLELPGKLKRSAQRQDQNHHESHNVADDKLRKALPDLPDPGLLAYVHIDARRPDVSENERPNADEDIDENLNGRGGAKDPTFSGNSFLAPSIPSPHGALHRRKPIRHAQYLAGGRAKSLNLLLATPFGSGLTQTRFDAVLVHVQSRTHPIQNFHRSPPYALSRRVSSICRLSPTCYSEGVQQSKVPNNTQVIFRARAHGHQITNADLIPTAHNEFDIPLLLSSSRVSVRDNEYSRGSGNLELLRNPRFRLALPRTMIRGWPE
jgi:hypothetical protein